MLMTKSPISITKELENKVISVTDYTYISYNYASKS